VTATSTGTGLITIGAATAPTGEVTVNATVKGVDTTTQGAIAVTGGTSVEITQTAANAVNTTNTFGAVTVTGNASTTSVSVSQSDAATAAADVVGVVNSAVTINDKNAASATAAGTITTVSLSGFAAATIDSSALTTLDLSGTGTSVSIGRGALTATPTANTLALNVSGLTTTAAITDAEAAADDGFQTINLTATGDDSTIASLVAVDAKSLVVAGDAAVELSAVTLTSLTSVTVSGGAGLNVDVSGIAGVTSVTSTSTGDQTLTVANTALTVTTGAGDDSVEFTGAIAAKGKVDLGAGDDTLTVAGASVAGASVTGGDGEDTLVVVDGTYINGTVTYNSFEVADLSGIATSTLNMSNLASATKLAASAALGGDATLTNVAAGTDLYLSNTSAALATTNLIDYDLKTDTASDALTVNLTTTDTASKAVAGKGDDSVNAITVTALTANDIETMTFNTSVTNIDDGNKASDYVNVVTKLTAADLTTLVYTGNASLTITDIDSAAALTKVDASAATGKLNINLGASGATGAIAVIGGSAADTVTMTGNSVANNIIQGNGGADAITLAVGGTKETVRYAADTDSVLVLTDTTDPVVSPVVYDVASGYDTIGTFTSGEDKIELSSALGLATGDARSSIAGKSGVGDNTVTNAELAAALQTLIGTGADFFNDGVADRALAQSIVNDATDATMLFVDVNADGDFTLGTDGMIYLTGVTTGVVISDIVFG